MPNVSVIIYPWENPKVFRGDMELKKGDSVIVPTDQSNELGIVDGILSDNVSVQDKILRLATDRDKSVYKDYQKEKNLILKECKKMSKEKALEMKLLDVMVSLDGKQVIVAFTADGRVDFRELVKNLSSKFKKSVRMQQIGSRDEAKRLGGYGICGRELCCVKSSGNMQSITTEMAKVQQIAHRGADRISGLCGRLMCCLAYEAEQYKEMLQGMPELYSNISTYEGDGVVIEINGPLQEIKVRLESGKYITIKKSELK